jgi:hypothetical protein
MNLVPSPPPARYNSDTLESRQISRVLGHAPAEIAAERHEGRVRTAASSLFRW